MSFIHGLRFNLKGLALGLRTPGLLFLGILRFVIVIGLTLLFSGMIFVWHQEIMDSLWNMPEQGWILYVWTALSWLLTLILAGVAAVLAYLTAQILFCVFIMDYMSRITERMVLGKEIGSDNQSFMTLFFYLIKQEIPRAIIPVVLMLILMVLGLLTPFGPFIAVLSSVTAAVFLAWDNTDLVPARRMVDFNQRLGYLKKNLLFHLGFGLWFLVPFANILFLSFAPVGATLYYLESKKKRGIIEP